MSEEIKDKHNTVLAKSKQKFKSLIKLINKFPHINKRLGILILIILAIPITVGLALLQQELRSRADRGDRKIVFGVYHRGNEYRGTPESDERATTIEDIKGWANRIGGEGYFPKLVLMPFSSFKVNGSYGSFNDSKKLLNEVIDEGGLPILTWMPKDYTRTNDLTPQQIIDGNHDAYIRKYAQDIVENRSKFILRLAHEMNLSGSINPWSRAHEIDGPTYVAMYRHIAEILREEGARKYVKLEWCPGQVFVNDDGKLKNSLDNNGSYYPGNRYVDYLGFDSYSNEGQSFPSMYDLYKPTYDAIYDISGIDSSKPLIVTETEVDGGTDEFRATWWRVGINRVYNDLPKIKAILPFRFAGENYNSQSLAVLKQIVRTPKFQGTAYSVLDFPLQDISPTPTPPITSVPPPTGINVSPFVDDNCTKNVPSLDFVDTSKTGKAGSTVTYSFRIKNNDSPSCDPRDFRLTLDFPENLKLWTYSPSMVKLSPSELKTIVLKVTSGRYANPGTKNLKLTITNRYRPLTTYHTQTLKYIVR